MAWCWLSKADSDLDSGTPVPSLDPPLSDSAEIAIPEELEPVDYRILTLRFEGARIGGICETVNISRDELQQRIDRVAFKDLEHRVEKAMLARITGSGDFEPSSAAKAEAPKAMQRIIAQSRSERDPKVRLAANEKVLKFAGIEPARRVEVTTPDKILDQMTPEELALFAAHRQWPGRFREALRAYLPTPRQLTARAPDEESAHDGEIADEAEPQQNGVKLTLEDDVPASSLPPIE